MKHLFLAALLFCAGCSTFGQAICRQQEKVSVAIAKAGGFLGPPGEVLAELLNLGLTVLCSGVDTVGQGCDAVLGAVGIGGDAQPPAPPAPPAPAPAADEPGR